MLGLLLVTNGWFKTLNYIFATDTKIKPELIVSNASCLVIPRNSLFNVGRPQGSNLSSLSTIFHPISWL